MNLKVSSEWLLWMAEKESGGCISAGGWVARVNQEEARLFAHSFTLRDARVEIDRLKAELEAMTAQRDLANLQRQQLPRTDKAMFDQCRQEVASLRDALEAATRRGDEIAKRAVEAMTNCGRHAELTFEDFVAKSRCSICSQDALKVAIASADMMASERDQARAECSRLKAELEGLLEIERAKNRDLDDVREELAKARRELDDCLLAVLDNAMLKSENLRLGHELLKAKEAKPPNMRALAIMGGHHGHGFTTDESFQDWIHQHRHSSDGHFIWIDSWTVHSGGETP